MPDPVEQAQRKTPRRFWLFAPYAAVAVALIAWTGVWFAEKARIEQALDAEGQALRASGYTAAWDKLSIDGWPFRLHIVMTAPKLADASGWSLTAPRVEGEGLPYAPDRWVFAAPGGVTVTRPGKGALIVTGRAIRASVGALGTEQPRYSFEALNVTLTPQPGALPAPFTAAARLEAHLQPGPDDMAAVLIRIEDAALRPDAVLARLQPGKPFGLVWDARMTHLSQVRGPNWPAAVQAWVGAGGTMTLTTAHLGVGDLSLQGSGGTLTANADGRLQGSIPVKVDAGRLGALNLAGPLALRFEDGQASIGPIPLGPAMKIG